MEIAHETMIRLALLLSLLALVLSAVALWPQYKDRLAVVRDVILWIALAIVGLGCLAPGRFKAVLAPSPGSESPEPAWDAPAESQVSW
ncbi:MAG TPA: hypothetical protein VIY86_00410 [Pirellulaceae bacterium]